MSAIGWFIRMLARGLSLLGLTFTGMANLLRELLPALLPFDQLSKGVRGRYDTVYTSQSTFAQDEIEDHALDTWEADVMNRYHINTGRMLAMGTGRGREAIAIARRGITVVGVEINPIAVQEARRFAAASGIPARFHRADFTALPYADASFDFALLATTMYSAIPGTGGRQTWLRNLSRLLKPGGLAIVSFEREFSPPSRARAISRPLNAVLHKLPGANRGYQSGDSYSAEHYMHVFQNKEEIRTELTGAGASIRELNWVRSYAVLTFSTSPNTGL
jgi:ubiquinone/menaquinone biosynthesis C-methylase UbiE